MNSNTINHCTCDTCADKRILEAGRDCIASFQLSEDVSGILEAHMSWIFLGLVSLVVLRWGSILSEDTSLHVADHLLKWLEKYDFFQDEVPAKIRRVFSALVVCAAQNELESYNLPQMN
jgi:hypothetical protein